MQDQNKPTNQQGPKTTPRDSGEPIEPHTGVTRSVRKMIEADYLRRLAEEGKLTVKGIWGSSSSNDPPSGEIADSTRPGAGDDEMREDGQEDNDVTVTREVLSIKDPGKAQ